jgi:hypothetical protein
MVTKSGTNAFHGDLNEYNRNTDLTANTYFNKIANPVVPRPSLIRNQFGGAIGGPIKRNKLFFFFDFNQSRIIQNAQVARTVPLDSYRNGNISYINNNAGCTKNSRQNTTASCISALTPAQVKSLDPAGIGADSSFLSFMNTRYPHVNDPTGGDGVNSGFYRFNAPTPTFETNYVGRMDYTINSKMKLFGRGTVVRENQVRAAVQFPGDPQTTQFIDRSHAWVVGHTWTINGRMVNNAYGGETVADLAFPNTYNPQGTSLITFATGTQTPFTAPYTSPSNAQYRIVPTAMFGDDFSWQKGSHNIQFGGSFKWINTTSDTILDYNSFTIGLGGNNQNLNAALRPSNIAIIPGSTTPQVTYDNPFTVMLGRVGNLATNYNYNNAGNPLPYGTGDLRKYKYYQTQLYIADTWKLSSEMTFSYGLNWQIFSVPYETRGLETVQNFTFDQYFSQRVAQSASALSGNTAVPFITYTLGGKVNNGPPLYQPSYKDFAPRFAFAYNPHWSRNSVINGGIGVVYDRSVINAVQYQQDQHNYLFQGNQSIPNGVAGSPQISLLNDPRIGPNNALPTPPTPPSGIKPPFTPYVTGSVPNGLAGGQFSTAIDPSLKTPYSIGFNFGVQHAFRGGYVLKASYVGRLGRRLLAYADASQIIDFTDPKSGQKMSTAFGNITQQTRAGANTANLPAQPWFENILALPGHGGYPNNTSFVADELTGLVANGDFADTLQALSSIAVLPPNVGMAAQFGENGYYTNKGNSTYGGLLTTLQKNFSHGLQFDLNYTWAHSIDNVSLIANTNAVGGYGFICDVTNPNACRANSDFDVKNYITADFTYQLPFGRGREFFSKMPWVLNEIVGGWDVSGITTWHSGNAISTGSSAFLAGFANDAPGIFNGDRAGIAPHANKNAATGQVNLFANPARANADYTGPVGLTFGSRNNLRGPNYISQDMGLAKNFPIVRDRVVLKLRADAFNVFNHASFSPPATDPAAATDITLGTFGQITGTAGTAPQRIMQVSGRIEF